MTRRIVHLKMPAALSAALCLAACSVSVPHAATSGSWDIIGSEAQRSGGVSLRIANRDRNVQALPQHWDSAGFTLSNSNLLFQERTESLPRSAFSVLGSAISNASLFTNARPGAGYALFASTYRDTIDGAVRNAMGFTGGLTLTAAAPAQATLTMTPLFAWTANDLANTQNDSGYSGDGAHPLSSKLNRPRGIGIAPDGTLYVADALNPSDQGDPGHGRIRAINAARNRIDTLVSEANFLPRGIVYAVGGDIGAAKDALFITDTKGAIARVCIVKDLDGTPIFETFVTLPSIPRAMAYDATSKKLYVSCEDDAVRAVDMQTQAITTFSPAPGGAAWTKPEGLALDATAGTLYVADAAATGRIIEVNVQTRAASLLAGGGPLVTFSADGHLAASASLAVPTELAYDAFNDGHLYVLESGSKLIRVISLGNRMIATAYGGGNVAGPTLPRAAQLTPLDAPRGMAVYSAAGSASLFVSDDNRVRSATP